MKPLISQFREKLFVELAANTTAAGRLGDVDAYIHRMPISCACAVLACICVPNHGIVFSGDEIWIVHRDCGDAPRNLINVWDNLLEGNSRVLYDGSVNLLNGGGIGLAGFADFQVGLPSFDASRS